MLDDRTENETSPLWTAPSRGSSNNEGRYISEWNSWMILLFVSAALLTVALFSGSFSTENSNASITRGGATMSSSTNAISDRLASDRMRPNASYSCKELFVGVFLETCFLYDPADYHGMMQWYTVGTADGVLMETLADDEAAPWFEYGMVIIDKDNEMANAMQNCHATYPILYSDDAPAGQSSPTEYFVYNTWNGKDFLLTELGQGLTCQFQRLVGEPCRTALNFLDARIPRMVTNISVDYGLCSN